MGLENGVLGGGGLGYTVKDGNIYIKADDLAGLFGYTGAQMGVQAILNRDQIGGAVAQALLLIAEKTDALASELLKTEAEASLKAMLGLGDDEVE